MLAQRLDIILEALRKAGFTPTEFLKNLLTAPEERFACYHDTLYKDSSSRLSDFLNVVWEDPKGHEHLTEWMGQGPAIDIICKDIERHMEALKLQMLMSTKNITIDYLQTWSINDAIQSADVPEAWTRILESASRGPQSDENTKKSPKLVS